MTTTRVRMCKAKRCDGRVSGRSPNLIPLCPSCRWLGRWAFAVGGVIGGIIVALLKLI